MSDAAAAVEELLNLNAAREGEMLRGSAKVLAVLVGMSVIGFAPHHIRVLGILGVIGVLGLISVGIGVVFGTALRRLEASKFFRTLRVAPDSVVKVFANVNVAGFMRSGKALVLVDAKGRAGSAPFRDGDVGHAIELIKRACANAKT